MRPNLDNTQLFEIMRRSAKDIGAPGFDHASGYGLLSIPNALVAKAPIRDLQEPNEEPNQIEPHATFATGTTPMTQPGRTSATITARVEKAEDPVDLYRVWSPAGMTLRARLTGSVVVRVLPRSANLKRTRPLAVSKDHVAAYRNTGKAGYVYLEIRPNGVRSAQYTVRLTAARR